MVGLIIKLKGQLAVTIDCEEYSWRDERGRHELAVEGYSSIYV